MPFLPDPTAPAMPMARAVLPLPPAAAPLNGSGHAVLPMPGASLPVSPSPAAPMPAVMPAMPTASGMMPPPGASANPPWQTRQQPDGSSVAYIPGPTGDGSDDVVIAVNAAPKLPRAFQPPAAPKAQ